MRLWFASFVIEVTCLLVCYGRIERNCNDGDPNCIDFDFDYHHEEAAKADVLNNSHSIVFNTLTEQKSTEEPITHTDNKENIKDWWTEWYDAAPELLLRKAEDDIETLCKASETENIYRVCQDDFSSMIACVDTVNGIVDQCENIRNNQLPVPICKEMSSKRVVTCGPYGILLCYPIEENKPPVTPCHDPFRQICLSQNGSLIKCIERSYFADIKINISQSVEHKETSDWWDKWKLFDREQKKNDTEKEFGLLCLENNGKDHLSYCNGSKSDIPACLNVTVGEIGKCQNIIGKDRGVPICSEVSSKRVITCDKNNELCFPVGDEKKPIKPCEVEDLQICLNDDGQLKKCTNLLYPSDSDDETSKNITNPVKKWNDWWAEWISSIPVTKEGKEVFLCHPDKGNKMLKTCDEQSTDKRVCVSAKYGEIDICKNFDEASLPVTLCIEESSNKVISCKDYGSAYLCSPSGNEDKPIRPCWSESRHLCLDNEGLLQKCFNLLPHYNSEYRDNTTVYNDYNDMIYYFNLWWSEWFSSKNALQINLPEGVSKRLCYDSGRGIVDCLYDLQNNSVCVGAVTGQIEVCEDMLIDDLPIPLCREIFTNKVITCGRHTLAFLCFPTSKKGILFKPCGSIRRQACLGKNGIVELCAESPPSLSFFRNYEKVEKMSQQQRKMDIWTDWWKEWKTGSSRDEAANIIEKPLCKHDYKKIIVNCKKGEIKKMICVSARYKKIGLCEMFLDTDLPVRICIDISSKRIMACGNNTTAFLCAQKKGESPLIRPCRSHSFQICLNSEGFLERCLDYTGLSTSSKVGELISAEDIYARDREMSELTSNRLRYLCKNDNDSRILHCSTYFSHPPACINTRNRKIETCEKIERYSDIGLPVCVDVSTSELLTCAKFNEENLCFTKSKETTRLVVCKTKSRNVCITEEGLVTKCSESFESSEDYSDEDDNSSVLTRIESKNFEYEQKNITFLCMEGRKNFKECLSDPSTNFTCFSSRRGIFHACEIAVPSDLTIPVCIEGTSKSVVTCGKMNNVNLCSSPGTRRYKYKPCNSEKYFVCLRDGSIQKCQNNDNNYSKKTKLLVKLLYTNIKNNDYEVSTNQTYYKAQKVENKMFKFQQQNCSRLCVNNSLDTIIVQPCEEDPYINFACLGVSEGVVDSCELFRPNEIVTPICVKTTDEVVTYGMFFKSYLCFEKEGDKIQIKTCNIQEKRVCLSVLGTFEECNKSDPRNSQVTETNETLEDYIEELTDYDVSSELVTVSHTNSNIKARKSKEGKQKSDWGSYRRLKKKNEIKMLEKISGREDKQSKKVKDEKYKTTKKDHDKSKKSESTEMSKEAKTELKTGENNKQREIIEMDTNGEEKKQNLSERTYMGYTDDDTYELHEVHVNIEKRDADYFEDYLDSVKTGREMLGVPNYQKKDLELAKEGHRNAIREKESKLIENINSNSNHLCKLDTESEKLVNCERDSQQKFACMRVNDGTLLMCQESNGVEIVLPVCFEGTSKNLVTCDIISNVELCLGNADDSSTLTECESNSSHACLVDNVPEECRKHDIRRFSQIPYANPNDEKFHRLHCENCSITSKFIVKGKLPGYLPELEVITLPPIKV